MVDLKDDGSIKVNDELRKEADGVRQHFRAHIERGIDRDLRLQELEDENRTLREIINERDTEIGSLGDEVAKLTEALRRTRKKRRR